MSTIARITREARISAAQQFADAYASHARRLYEYATKTEHPEWRADDMESARGAQRRAAERCAAVREMMGAE